MITIWHNPRCSKSRQALALLEEKGHALNVRLYLRDKPDAGEIRDLLNKLGMRAFDLARRGEKVWKELALSDASTEAEIVQAMATHPVLIERPVVVADDRAVVARPPETLVDFL